MPQEALWERTAGRRESLLEVKKYVKRPWTNKERKSSNSFRHLALIIEGAGADINVDPVLHAACSLDLQKFCRDIPQGAG